MSDDHRFNQPSWNVHTVNNIYMGAAEFAGDPRARGYLRMLAVLAAPLVNARGDGPPTARAREIWGEWERLRLAAGRAPDPSEERGAPWAIVRLAPPTAGDLRQALIPHDPGYQMIHLSCHTNADGLALEDTLGRECWLPAGELVAVLRDTTVRLVVLNAGAAESLARVLVKQVGIPCVIATRAPLDDRAATILSMSLYGALAAGATTGAALEPAQRAIAALTAGDQPTAPPPGDPLILLGDAGLRLASGDHPALAPRLLAHPAAHNHPLPFERLGGFVGRAPELLRLGQWFAQPGRRAFTISGVGGIGKTSLALNAALRHAYRFRALAFASAKDLPGFGPLQVLQALNEALDMTTGVAEADNLPGAIARRLNASAVLLVLDNLENVAPEHAAELARALGGLDPTGGSRVLMTLRPLDLAPLTGLADRRDRLDLPELDRASGLRLAWEEVARQQADMTPATAGRTLDAAHAAELEHLREEAGLPAQIVLAELAALDELAGLAFHHPALLKLAAAIAAEDGWMAATRRLVRWRGQDVEQALDDLIGRMLDALLERAPGALPALYAALVCAGGAEERHLRAIVLNQQIDDDDDTAIDFKDQALRPAERANLLTRLGPRYHLDPPVRAYLERRRPPPVTGQAEYRLRHAEVYLALFAAYDAAIREGRMTYSAPLEWNNVTAALDHLVERAPGDERAMRLLVVCAQHWRNVLFNNHDPRRMRWIEAARHAAERVGSPLEQAHVLYTLGDVQQFRKQTNAAQTSYQQALTLFHIVGDLLGEANTLLALGDVQRFRAEYEAAQTSYRQALILFRTISDRLGEANTLLALGDVQKFWDEYEAAQISYRQALILFRIMGDYLGEANTLLALGDLQKFWDEYEAAQDIYRQALALFRTIGDPLGEANSLKALGDVQRFRYEYEGAQARYQQTLTLFRAIGDRLGEANTLLALGDVQQFRKQTETAQTSYQQALTLFRAMGDPLGKASTFLALGDVQRFREEYEAAHASYQQALTVFLTIGSRLGEANTLLALGDVQRFRAEYEAAQDSYRRALILFRTIGDRLGEANTLVAVGDMQRFRKQTEAAQASYQQALTLYRAIDSRLGEANALAAQSGLLIHSSPAQSQELLDEALALSLMAGSFYNVGIYLYNYGITLLERWCGQEALGYFQRARVLFDEHGIGVLVRQIDRQIAMAQVMSEWRVRTWRRWRIPHRWRRRRSR